MSGKNISSFMKNSSLHVANINRNLQNAKSDVLVDYLHSENSSITVITNKVAQQSDMCYKTSVWTDFRVRVRTLGNY